MSSRRWAEKFGQCLALLGALMELLGSVYFAVFNQVDFVSIMSGNLNVGAAILAMFGECCDNGHGDGPVNRGSPNRPPDRIAVVILFASAGGFNFGAAAALFTHSPMVVGVAWFSSGLAFVLQLVAVAVMASSAKSQPSMSGTSQAQNQNSSSF